LENNENPLQFIIRFSKVLHTVGVTCRSYISKAALATVLEMQSVNQDEKKNNHKSSLQGHAACFIASDSKVVSAPLSSGHVSLVIL